jgi:hypothetical protein
MPEGCATRPGGFSRKYFFTVALILTSPFCQKFAGREAPLPQVEKHVSQVIESLPPDNKLRLSLEEGNRGEGVRYPWMDLMKTEGVRRALLVVSFDWDGRAKNVMVDRAVYYNKYDTDCAQISDRARLESIRVNGLEQQLIEFAMNRTAASRWITIDNPRPHTRGVNRVYALDDEWLPRPSTAFYDPGTYSGNRFPPGFFEDEAAVAQYAASGKKSQHDLDEALFEAVNESDDSCVIAPLVKAGANVNPQNVEGTTPLSIAVGDGSANNVRSLLEAGGDVNFKDRDGKTLLWNAEQGNGRYYSSVVSLLKKHGARL